MLNLKEIIRKIYGYSHPTDELMINLINKKIYSAVHLHFSQLINEWLERL